MCGIAGIVTQTASRCRSALERMVSSLGHRGPDGSGIHIFPYCALGHTRLSIVDLATGDQPMLSPDGNVAIIFNGEIYGYCDIKRKLQDYQFQTTSDTEVIIALYHRHGRDLLQHLPGMFAFAIWDEHEQTLFAARDRFGEKPFYYTWGRNGEFLFASEIKALIESGLFKPKISEKALTHYLRHLYVHPHETIYSNVFVLPPAHCLSLKNGQLSVEKYWCLPLTKEPLSEHDAVAEFQRLFEQAVKRQLVADVPVGAFLSGGLDSSSVVAVASHSYLNLKTFSFGFGESINELPFAREIAQLYKTEHIELEDHCTDIADLLLLMAHVYDEPFADSSNIPMYLISQEARRHGKVVLTGDGGDELLAGYDFWYRKLWEIEQGNSPLANVISLLKFVSRSFSKCGLPRPDAWQHIIKGVELRKKHVSIAQAHLEQNVYFNDHELSRLRTNGATALPISVGEVEALTDTVDAALRMDLCNYMPGDILLKIDRASMAHGLELRAPFLDVDFASFCISLPSRLKITAQQDKWILRQCYSRAWTDAVRNRGKQGFGAPVSHWLKRDSVANLKSKVLSNPRHPLFSLISFDASRSFVAADNYQTWILLTLGLWLERGGEESL